MRKVVIFLLNDMTKREGERERDRWEERNKERLGVTRNKLSKRFTFFI